MKKHFARAAFAYAALAMVFGVFYREFTKFSGFTGQTTLSVMHPHYFLLGMVFCLVMLMAEQLFSFMPAGKGGKILALYHVGLNVTCLGLFLRGLAPMVGFQSDTVLYERSERFAGESKYPLKKMLAFAIDGITSFSVKPLRLITNAGIVVFLISLVMLLYTLISWIAGRTVAGWTSTLASIWMLGGIQLLSLGVIGEYIGKVYNETKQRPRFIIDRYLNDRGDDPVADRPE